MGLMLGARQCSDCCPAGSCATRSATSGGAGTTTDIYEFPPAEHCVRLVVNAYFVPDTFVVSIGGNEVWNSGEISDSKDKCFNKPEGETTVEVTVIGPDGTVWDYEISCDDCSTTGITDCCDSEPFAECGGYSVYKCKSASEYTQPGVCADADTFSCDQSCDSQGASVVGNAPYDCVNTSVFNISGTAFVQVDGVPTCPEDTSGYSQEYIDACTEAESRLNDVFAVPLTCFGSVEHIFDLGDGWFATVTVDLCDKSASVTLTDPSTQFQFGASYSGTPLTQTPVACNDFNGCNCEVYGGTVTGGTGTINVA